MASLFAVIGLGVFGRHVALNLKQLGNDVLAVDSDETLINVCADELETVVCADSTDEAALRELEVDKVRCAVVAIGAQSVEASILTTTLLRQIGVPQIVARSVNPLHARVLHAVGAHMVVRPEEEMGQRLAHRLAHPNVLERLELGADAELAEIEAPAEFVGRSLVDLDLRRRLGVSVVAVRRESKVLATFDGNSPILQGDVLLIIGTPKAIHRLASRA
jgi:trk system potassium uptake protein TrkA